MTSVSTRKRETKAGLAEILGLTTRQISNLVEEGMPREVAGNRVWFDVPACVQWYVKRLKEQAREGADEKKNLTTRRLELEVQMQEIELAKAQGQLVTLDYMEDQFSTILQRLRAKILNLPGKYSPAMVGLRTIAEAQTRLEGVSTEMVMALSDTGDDPELDEENEGAV